MTVVTKAAFAKHIGVSAPAVTKMAKAGRIPVRPDGKVNLEEAVVAYEATKVIGKQGSKQNGKKAAVANKQRSGGNANRSPSPVDLDSPDDEMPVTTGGITQARIAEQFNKAKLAEKTFMAKLKEIEYKKARGELLELDEVRADAKETAEDIRAKLFAIAPKLAATITEKTPREAQRMIEESINNALSALHKSRFAKEH